ncbi:hypothetical protein K435DRAFT_864872 [Dendrothele bispora CBS 962.96]|uniref:Uncharacterized protein n=1 Tax=Dendrothele bispora (strain CBS 962.96) TaxID=1314807 RepID=A0A4S8LLN9_DENBC|nr:hypothetical protein K435DRAFT_864872 [Dendrothele bispora CBS 962.96]
MVPALCIPSENTVPLIAPLNCIDLEVQNLKDCKAILPVVFKANDGLPTRICTTVWRDKNCSLLRANLVDVEAIFTNLKAVRFDIEIHVGSRCFLVSGYYDQHQPYNKSLKKLDIKWRGEVAIFPMHLKDAPTFIVGAHIPQIAFKRAVARFELRYTFIPCLTDIVTYP